MSGGYQLAENVSLEGRNTFRVPARAAMMADVTRAEALSELFDFAMLREGPVLVLGEGSNLLFAGDHPGVVICLAMAGTRVLEDDGAHALVRADAGVNWNDFVRWTLGKGLAGLENTSLIPGTVGACPIQNIGAYGVEVREFIHAVEAFEPATGKLHRFPPAACAFAYRDSRFKHAPDRYIVTAVEFALSRTPTLHLDYAGIREELADMGVTSPAARHVADAVIAIRRRKLPDPAVIGNAGSFFKNPMVPAAQAGALQTEHPALPVFRGNDAGTRKLSAGWLIDQCGWKGHRDGDAGVAASHALVLVNHGQATGQQLLDLARRIADSVRTRFGVALEPEPRVIGATW